MPLLNASLRSFGASLAAAHHKTPHLTMSVLYPSRLSGQQIRILKLYHGSASDAIETRLIPANVPTDTDFEALSYVWGDATIRTPILCNDVEIRITQNLQDALLHLRLPHAPRLVWVDAICINQDDLEERNQQVSLMHQIFIAKLQWLPFALVGTEERTPISL